MVGLHILDTELMSALFSTGIDLALSFKYVAEAVG